MGGVDYSNSEEIDNITDYMLEFRKVGQGTSYIAPVKRGKRKSVLKDRPKSRMYGKAACPVLGGAGDQR